MFPWKPLSMVWLVMLLWLVVIYTAPSLVYLFHDFIYYNITFFIIFL
jgi:hypothetical protein